MGKDNSKYAKPLSLSEEAWERILVREYELEKQKIEMYEKLHEEIRKDVITFSDDYREYCNACEDVPKIMMFMPNYRERCSQARGRMINSGAEVAIKLVGMEIVNNA
jgi:hypothetical protein